MSSLAACSRGELARRFSAIRRDVSSAKRSVRHLLARQLSPLVAEAVRRTTGCTLYNVQIAAGRAMAQGHVVQMQTGEGKTLTGVLPAVTGVAQGLCVHVATVNQYLAERDFQELQSAFDLLGISVGLLQPNDDPQTKRNAYASDVTFGAGYEFGFDFLRDRAALRRPSQKLGDTYLSALRGDSYAAANTTMQRGHGLAVIDEADSVLIDEAITPLVIAHTPAEDAASSRPLEDAYRVAHAIARDLVVGNDFVVDPSQGTITLTESGDRRIFERRQLPTALLRPWSQYVTNALRAQYILRRDHDYVVRDDEVHIVDAFTGRIFAERSWQDGLHQAVQVCESLPVTLEHRATAMISRQRFYQMYDRICGMTGTIIGDERELRQFYGAKTTAVPTRLRCRRQVLPDRYFVDNVAKWRAVVEDVATRHRNGQPVLIGASSVDESAAIGELLTIARLPHQILNGVQDAAEAAIVACAGDFRTITVSTNIAGRGTNIVPCSRALERGGLHVIGTHRNDARRIDRQLAGRAARQGNPGSVQFYLAATDSLFRDVPTVAKKMRRRADAGGECRGRYESVVVRLQRRREQAARTMRREVAELEAWRNELRSLVAEDTV